MIILGWISILLESTILKVKRVFCNHTVYQDGKYYSFKPQQKSDKTYQVVAKHEITVYTCYYCGKRIIKKVGI